jgi:hypothetical protein
MLFTKSLLALLYSNLKLKYNREKRSLARGTKGQMDESDQQIAKLISLTLAIYLNNMIIFYLLECKGFHIQLVIPTCTSIFSDITILATVSKRYR